MARLILLAAFLLSATTALAQITPFDPARLLPTTVDTTQLRLVLEHCRLSGADGCSVAYQGATIAEWVNPDIEDFTRLVIDRKLEVLYPGGAHYGKIGTASMVKSWTGLLVGMLVDDGKIPGVDAAMTDILPEWQAGADSAVTLRHLLTMTSGLLQRRDTEGPKRVILLEERQTAFALEQPPDVNPGTRWSYSNEGVQLLEPIIRKAAGMSAADFAQERLFGPLGMADSYYTLDADGKTITYGGAYTSLADMMKVGQLVLNRGRWGDRQIISEEWVEMSTTPIPLQRNYGFLWWLHEGTHSISAMGDPAQQIVVFPDLELVVGRMSVGPTPAKVAWQSLTTLELLRTVIKK